VIFVHESVCVEMTTYGGVALHFSATDRHPTFTVWSTAGGHWAIHHDPLRPDPNTVDRFNSLSEACWSKMQTPVRSVA